MQQIILTPLIKFNLLRTQHVHLCVLLLALALGGLQLQVLLLKEALVFSVDGVVHAGIHLALHRIYCLLE